MRLPVLLTIVLLLAGLFLGVGTIWGLQTERARLNDEAERRLQSALRTAAGILEGEAKTTLELAIAEGERFVREGAAPGSRGDHAPLTVVYGSDGKRLWPANRAFRREDDILPGGGEARALFEQARRYLGAGQVEMARPLLDLAESGEDLAVRAAARVLKARRLMDEGQPEKALAMLRDLLGDELPLATSATWYALTELIRDAATRRDQEALKPLVGRLETEILPLAGEGATGRALAEQAVEILREAAPESHSRLRERVETLARARLRIDALLPSGPPRAEVLPADRIVPLPLGSRTAAVRRVDLKGRAEAVVVALPSREPPKVDVDRGFRLRPIADLLSEGEEDPGGASVSLSGYASGFVLVAEPLEGSSDIPWRTAAVIGFLALCFIAMGLGLRAVWQGIRREEAELTSRSEFLAGVSHQLKTPVANLRLFAETLASGKVDDPQDRSEMHQIIGVEAERLGENLERILAVARLDTHEAERKDFAADRLLAAVSARWEQVTASRELRWEVSLADDLPRLRGDERALADALHNVVDNAVRNSKPADVVRLKAWREEAELIIDVIDQGPGIPREDADRVFDRFYRGASGHGEGSGLGLAIARDGARRAGGTVMIARSDKTGTTMRFRLPAWRS